MPDLWFCSASTSKQGTFSDITRAMKILWRPLSLSEAANEAKVLSRDELELPESLKYALFFALEDNSMLLPLSNRTYQNWNVSLLRRFSIQHSTTA